MPRIEYETKRIFPIVLAVEASDNMAGERIVSINETVRACQSFLLDVAGDYQDVEVKIAVIKYGDSAELVTDGFESISQLDWTDIEACGKANLGKAIELMDTKLLQKKSILCDDNATSYCIPTIVFFASSPSTDDYLISLSNANNNYIFRGARKVCVAIGDAADIDTLARLSGNSKEGVIKANDLDTLKVFFNAIEMPGNGRMPEDFDSPCNMGSKLCEELASIVKVDGIETRANFWLQGVCGSSVSIIGSTDIARCQVGPCEPEDANDIMFRVENHEDYLALTNSMNIEELYVSFYIDAEETRTIVGYYGMLFAVTFVSGNEADDFIMFEIEENGIKVSNNSSGAIYFKAIIDSGMCTHLRNNDIIQKGNDDLFTVKSKKVEEESNPTEVVILDGDIGGWE